MKKEYEKPIAELVVFEMNEAIANCQNKVYASPEVCAQNLDPNINLADSSCTYPIPESYCYNTPDGMIFGS